MTVFSLTVTCLSTYSNTSWQDELTSFNGQAITYDATGNPISYLGHTLSWTMGRQLESFDGIAYTYNENGIITSKTVNGVTTRYYLDGTNMYAHKAAVSKWKLTHWSHLGTQDVDNASIHSGVVLGNVKSQTMMILQKFYKAFEKVLKNVNAIVMPEDNIYIIALYSAERGYIRIYQHLLAG